MMSTELLYRIAPWLIVLSAAAAITGCAPDGSTSAQRTGDASPALAALKTTPKAEPAGSNAAPAAKQIVRLVGRDSTITITSGPHGPLYSARAASGQMIVERVTLEDLRAEHPDLYQEVGGAARANQGTLIADLGD